MAHYLDSPIPAERVNYMVKRFSAIFPYLQCLQRVYPKGRDSLNRSGYNRDGDQLIYGQAGVILGSRVPWASFKLNSRDILAGIIIYCPGPFLLDSRPKNADTE